MTTHNARNLKVEPPRVITADWLLKRGACEEERKIFARQWPDGAELTAANVMTGIELGLSLVWLARKVLTAPTLDAFWDDTAPARRDYEEARVAAFMALVFCDTAGGPA